jgi:hypothetical protein
MKLCAPHERMKFFSNKSDTAFSACLLLLVALEMRKLNYNEHAGNFLRCRDFRGDFFDDGFFGQFEEEIDSRREGLR